MSTAGLARTIRRQLRQHHHERLFWRSWFYRWPKRLERSFQMLLTLAICTVVPAVIARFATWAADPVKTLLLINAIGSVACVFMTSKVRYYYDATDFPRLSTVAMLPWSDHQWLSEFLRGAVGSLIPVICFSLITLGSTAMLPTFGGDQRVELAFAAAAVQVLMVASLAFYVTSFSFKLLQSPRMSLWFGRAKIAVFVAIGLLLYPPISKYAVAWRLTDAIFFLPTAWPTAVLFSSAGSLSVIQASLGLLSCVVVAIAIAAFSIVRLKRTFKVAEIQFGPLGDGCLLCDDAWELYQLRRSHALAMVAGQSVVHFAHREQQAPVEMPLDPLDTNARTIDAEADDSLDDSLDETMQSAVVLDRNRLDGFWESQGWLGRWFNADERNVIAMQHLVSDSACSPWRFFRYHTGLMVIAATYFLIAHQYLPTALTFAVPLMLGSMALSVFAESTAPLAASYRSLPLLANQWLWPLVKYQSLRLMMLVPPGVALITMVMLVNGYGYQVISKSLSLAVVLPFVALPTFRLATHGHETRDRIRLVTVLGLCVFVIPAIIAGIGSVIGQFALDWPKSLFCVPITFVSLAVLWKLLCHWHDKGSVDHYVASKV